MMKVKDGGSPEGGARGHCEKWQRDAIKALHTVAQPQLIGLPCCCGSVFGAALGTSERVGADQARDRERTPGARHRPEGPLQTITFPHRSPQRDAMEQLGSCVAAGEAGPAS